MQTITIKPHHFIDIIKLYGSGINTFVPDKKMGHDFYIIGNNILNNHHLVLKLTTDSDDICQPCCMHKGNCIDTISHIQGFHLKNQYNQTLDNRIIALYQLDKNHLYTANELCSILLKKNHFIYQVWKEEDRAITEKRHKFFVLGATKFLESFRYQIK